MKPTVLLPLLLIGCAGAMVHTRDVADRDSEFRFEIQQTSRSMLSEADKGRIDVSFRITVTNSGKVPITVTRISMQSIEGSIYRLNTQTRKFDITIAPEANESSNSGRQRLTPMSRGPHALLSSCAPRLTDFKAVSRYTPCSPGSSRTNLVWESVRCIRYPSSQRPRYNPPVSAPEQQSGGTA